MRITILTLFPEMFESVFASSIVGRARANGVVSIDFVQIRDFALDTYKHVDDTPFGGGAGMVMKCQPVLDALASVRGSDSYVVSLTPGGTPYTQAKAHTLSEKNHLILLCGHYEGMDARIGHHVDEEISIGDYVLTGGEIGAMAIVDSVTRLLDGAIKAESTKEESFEDGLLEYPQYTKPADYEGDPVPAVLVSGNHQKIAAWRHAQSLLKTAAVRPDLLRERQLSKEDQRILEHPEEWQ